MANQSYEQAAALAGEHLALVPGDFDGLHLLGIALCHCGRVDEGRLKVEEAIALRPQHPDPHYNLGTTLLGLKQWGDAKTYLKRALTLAPNHYSAWNSLGLIHMHEGDCAEAATAYREAIRLNPAFPGAWRNLASALTELDEKSEGIRALREALRLEPNHPAALEALGGLLVEAGRVAEARSLVEQAMRSGVQSVKLLQILGSLCIQLADYEAARLHLEQALALEPDLHAARSELGVALSNLGQPDEARRCYETVLEAQPSNGRAWGHLAELLEMTNDLEAAEALTDRGLQQFPGHPVLTLVKARCERRLSRAEAAIDRLMELKAASTQDAPYLRAVYFELGRCLSKQGLSEKAMAAFVAGNRQALKSWKAGGGLEDPMLPAANYLAAHFRRTHQPVRQPDAAPLERLAFVVGFQRSGTTLVDTILDSHSQVQVVEESPALMNTANRFAATNPYPQGLSDLTAEGVAQLQWGYLKEIKKTAPLVDDRRLIVDKSPLNLVHLGLIQALFPNAPIVLLVRDPKDVCLSCFMQDFELSPFTARFCSLAETAQAYAGIMALQLHYEAQLSLNLLRVRYEDLVTDFDGQVKRMLAHLTLPWEPGLSEFYDHARKRGLVRTPSYHQISQPIYGTSVGRWHDYADHLKPLEPLLAPFIEHYGYSQ